MPAPLRANSPPLIPATWAVVLAGALTLAAAMGIGRFAFTPLLPLMMRDGQISAAGGAELAAANYLGYLVGAMTAGRLATQPLRLVRLCLPLIAALTAATGLVQGLPAWDVLRFGAGLCSAWALVGISSWSLSLLAQRGQGALGGLVFAGVGGGIILAGVMAWLAGALPARQLWLQFALAALLMSLAVLGLLWRVRPPNPQSTRAALPAQTALGVPARPANAHAPNPLPPGSWPMVICYGSFGFGYILPATFLPAMARALLDDPRSFGLAWPVFGLAAMLSTVLTLRWIGRWPPLRAWAICQGLMGLGVAMPLLSRSAWAIALAALLVGGTFLLATVIAMQQARAMAPLQPAPLLGRLTAAFALGQMLGPLCVRALSGVQWGGAGGMGAIEITSALATVLLLGTAAWLWRQAPAGR